MRAAQAYRRDRAADERDHLRMSASSSHEREGTAEQRELERLERLRQAELRQSAGGRRVQAELDQETAATERANQSH